jgi:drug/metabolite transporter (DMT)-like permease
MRTRPLHARSEPAGEVHPGRGLAALAVVVLVWSASNVIAKLISTTGIVVSFYRLWFAVPVVWLPVILRRNSRGLDRDWLAASLFGGALFALHQVLFFTSLKLTSVANVTVIGALQPVLVLLVAERWFGERSGASAWLWSVLAVLGTGCVIFGSSHGLAWSPTGDLLAAGNLFAFTAYFLASKRIRQWLPTWEYVAGLTTTAALLLSGIAWVSGQKLDSPRGWDWVGLVWIAWFPGTLGHVLSNWAHRHVSAFTISITFLAVPALASVLAAWLLDEPLTVWHALGGGLVFLAIAAAARRQLQAAPFAQRS